MIQDSKLKKLVKHKIINKKEALFLEYPKFDISNLSCYWKLLKKINNEYPILAIKPKILDIVKKMKNSWSTIAKKGNVGYFG